MNSSKSLADFTSLTDKSSEKLIEEKAAMINQVADSPLGKMTDMELQGFMKLYSRYLTKKGSELDWSLIQSPDNNMLKPYAELPAPASEDEAGALLRKLAVVKLNGGLGTSMGCTGPKSVIEVRGDATFLDLIVQQIEGLNKKYPDADVPLVLMNSFNTDADTAKIIQKYAATNVNITTFNQSRYPRVIKDSLEPMPLTHKGYDQEDWYPPGHGDFFDAFYNSGLVDTLIAQGKEYIFLSNVDNLGATVDVNILKMMESTGTEYCMELTDKTRADIKGGTIMSYNGKVQLLEVAQVPSKYMEEFKSITKFKVFNTNNIWMRLSAIKRIMASGGLELDIIVNPKSVGNKKVIQLETAVGAAIQFFGNACGVNVPRSRFLPVKATSDLLLIQSNMYNIKSGSLVMNPARQFTSVPVVKLGPEFKKVSTYMERFASMPDIIELDHLTVTGNVYFGSKVSLRGTVIIVANPGSTIMIPSGSILENKVITGNLHIMDH